MMAIEKDTVTSTEDVVMEEKNATTLAKKGNIQDAEADRRTEAEEAVKSAVSQYIEELREKEGSLAKIEQKLYDIARIVPEKRTVQKDTADKVPSFNKSLKNWLDKKNEPSLYDLCLLTQVHHVSYDYILGLDEKNGTNQLTYGYTLDFFSYLFRTKKVKVFRKTDPDLFPPVTIVASKDCFNMTRYIIVKDRILYDIIKELDYQKQIDLLPKNRDKVESRYKKALQHFISKYENEPLVPENCECDTDSSKQSPPDNVQNKSAQETYYNLPDDFPDRLRKLLKKYEKNQTQFSKDAGIPRSTFNAWIKDGRYPLPSNLYLMAKTYGFSVDSLLRTGASDKNDKKHPCKYTYGNTLRLIDQLLTARVIARVPNWKYAASLADNTQRHTKNYDGENPNNMNYSCSGEPGYISGIFFIHDDVLIRMITEIEAEMSRPFNAPQSTDTAQISYEMSQQHVNKFIAQYDSENLLCYRERKVWEALKVHSKKWHEYSPGHNDDWTSTLKMDMDLDEMLTELRDVEIDASKTL